MGTVKLSQCINSRLAASRDDGDALLVEIQTKAAGKNWYGLAFRRAFDHNDDSRKECLGHLRRADVLDEGAH